MEPTIKCGKHVVEHVDISGSSFHDVNLGKATFNDANMSEADFENVNLSKARFHDINLSDIRVSAVRIGGAVFKHVGPPPDSDGRQQRQRPVVFEEAMLCDSTFRKVDMSNVKIIDCNIEGMTIDGVPVADLLAEHRKNRD